MVFDALVYLEELVGLRLKYVQLSLFSRGGPKPSTASIVSMRFEAYMVPTPPDLTKAE